MKNVITIAVMALALVATSFVTSPAQADNFGAIAYSPSTGASGRSWDYPSRAGAENAALNKCRQYTSNCKVRVWQCTTR